MPTYRHKKTDVILNSVNVRRSHLSPIEEETARLLRSEGDDYHIIAAKFGINQGRIAELLGPEREKKAPGSDQPELGL